MAVEYRRIPHLVVHRLGAGQRDAYGTIGDEAVVLQAQLLRPETPSTTAVVAMHPIGSPAYMPMFSALARAGCHVIGCATRYSTGDHALIMEKALLDLGAAIHDARDRLGYERIVLAGWSGGGALMLAYQAQAEKPTIEATPAGEPVDIAAAGLVPADAVALLAAHRSRHHLLTEWLDPSIIDEADPETRIPELNLYDPDRGPRPPYGEEFVARYRTAQADRNRRITAWVRDRLAAPVPAGRRPADRAFVVHGTMADPRWLDPTLDPNDRRPNWCYLGDPAQINDGPTALARFSTTQSWLSQWSLEDAQCDGVTSAAAISVPTLVIQNSADDACPTTHSRAIFDAVPHADKEFRVISGANHYYSGPDQRPKLAEATETVVGWMADHGLG